MKHNQLRQVVFPILAAFIWGTAFVAQDLCADVIDTFTFNAARSYIAVVVLLIIIAIFSAFNKDKPTPTKMQKRAAAGRYLLRYGAGHRLQLPAGGPCRRYGRR